MPAEWEKHEATWVTFPHNENTWGDRLPHVQKLFGEMIAHVSSSERVEVLAISTTQHLAERLIFSHPFARREQIRFHNIATMDSWIRDYGPTFVVNRKEKKIAMVHWIFNAWGMKYDHEEPLSNDKIVPARMNETLQLHTFQPGIVMEGGSIEVNGLGTVITSEQCLLNANRNPHLKRAQIEEYLREYLNVDKVVWAKDGIEGDDTDGHIDDMVRFVSSNRVLCAMPAENDSNFPLMAENRKRLQAAGLEVIPLPMPQAIFVDDRRLPASYANFYIANSVVIVPIFNDPNDSRALQLIEECFPNRKIIGLESTDVVFGFGAWHCLTQQQPLI